MEIVEASTIKNSIGVRYEGKLYVLPPVPDNKGIYACKPEGVKEPLFIYVPVKEIS